MSDEKSVNPTSLDHKIDTSVKTKIVSDELYKENHQGHKIAETHSPLSDTTASSVRSWSMSEIERVIAANTITEPKKKLAQFGLDLSRRNDFRLKELTRKLKAQVSSEFDDEIKAGPVANRVRNFDVQSQSMRLIAANATLGSYQFQKTQVLPFMRKSLALSYEKVSLLKQTVSAIGGLEKAVVAKLEAIKMNTAASTPRKETLFNKLKNAIETKNIERVAGNVSNMIMAEWDERYKQHVSPLMQSLHRNMSKTGPNGGVTGVKNAVTGKLNRLRRQAAQFGERDTSSMTAFERLQNRGAKVASSVLGGAVRLGQKIKIAPSTNGFISKALIGTTSRLERLQPFSPLDVRLATSREPEDNQNSLGMDDLNTNASSNKLTNLVSGWRAETKAFQRKSLDHLDAIRQKIAPGKIPRPIGANKTKPIAGIPRVRSSQTTSSPTITKGPWGKFTVKGKSATPEMTFFQSLTSTMTKKLDAVNASIRGSDKNRTDHEKSQTRHQTLLEHLAEKARIRKGSYEEKMSRQTGKQGRTLFGRKMFAPTVALSTLGKHGDDDGGEGGGIMSDAWDMVKDKFGGDEGGDEKAGKKKTKATRRKSNGRFASKPKGLKGKALSLGKRGLGGLGGLGKSLGKKGLSSLGGLAKGGAGLAGKGLFNVAKSGVGIGLAAGVANHFWNKQEDGVVKDTGNTALSALQYGAMGAEVGALFGGVGAVPGAAIGASLGVVIANADYAANALKSMGNGIASAAGGISTFFFGRKATIDKDGKVVQDYKSSILGDVKTLFFGRDAKYAASGQLIQAARGNIISDIQYGLQKTFFGDKFNNGEYKEGTSILSMARDGVTNALAEFKNQLVNLPSQVKKDITNAPLAKVLSATKNRIVTKSKENYDGIVKRGTDAVANTKSFLTKTDELYYKFKDASKKNGSVFDTKSLFNFTMGVSSAVMGWAEESGYSDSPTSPYYAYVTEALDGYGVRNRGLYKLLHSLEISQDKVNNGTTKPFDDSDMIYMAGRFGFDIKNKQAVDYFKLWFKRRFAPGQIAIGKVLRSHKLDFGSVLGASPEELALLTADVKKELNSLNLKQTGLEPSVQAFNKYSKIGSAEPSGLSPSTQNTSKPFDPRNPNNTPGASEGKGNGLADILAKAYGVFTGKGAAGTQGNSSEAAGGYGGGSTDPTSVGRKKAAMVKGSVKDQPEFKAAYAKLPANIKQMVSKSKSLQFVLWSTAVQHGPDTASQIFQRDYSEQLDEKGYMRSIYQDRSSRFGNLAGGDRSEATNHLGEEQRFAMGIADGTSSNTRSAYGAMVNNTVDPNGNYSGGSGPVIPVKGSVVARAKSAVQHLMSRGLTKIAATGVAANLIGESSLNPHGPAGDGGRAVGLAQWHPDRQNPILRKFGKQNFGQMSFEDQLDAVVWEMSGGGKAGVGKDFLSKINAATNVGDVVRKMVYDYERPADKPGETRKRTGTALGLQRSLGDLSPAAPRSIPATGAPASTGHSDAAMAAFAKTPVSNKLAKPATRAAPAAPSAPASSSPDMSKWIAALDNHAAVLNKQSAMPAAGPTIISPIIAATKNNTGGGGFVAMSMKKARHATGN